MGFVEKRGRRYRAKYRDPLGRQRSRTFTLKADAERFVREMEVDIERGAWLDPRSAEIPLAKWASDFLALARRLSPTTVQTYRPDLDKYVLPHFGSYQYWAAAGRRNRELAQRRGGRRHRPQFGPQALPDPAARAPGGG
jgi:hypothetical protein